MDIEDKDIGRVKECVGCGYCCIKAPCEVELRIYGRGLSTCPELKWDGTRYLCNLCTKDILGPEYRKELYIGAGCCSNLNSWRKEVKPRRKEDIPEQKYIAIDPIFQIFLHVLGKEWISGDTLALTMFSFVDELKKLNYEKTHAEQITQSVVHYLKGQRSNFVNEFMG